VLFGVLFLASLGLPLPEDIPLIAAGVLLHTHPGIATWPWTLAVALVGIMAGDLILYRIGQQWGPEVVRHRFVCRLITPERFAQATARFHRYGAWFCFFGRFVMGVRAVMCMSAGATRYPYWRFFLADLAGAVLSTPLFLCLGYWFAGMIPTLRKYLAGVQGGLLLAGAIALALVVYYEYRKIRRARLACARGEVLARLAEGAAARHAPHPPRLAPDKHPNPAASADVPPLYRS
jgi:membrane protein DedA with SNARE-associated domain